MARLPDGSYIVAETDNDPPSPAHTRVRGQQAGIVLAHGDPTLAHRAGHHRPVCAPTAADALP
jgi:hypothetical protein